MCVSQHKRYQVACLLEVLWCRQDVGRRLAVGFRVARRLWLCQASPSKHGTLPGSMLAHRLRRWPNIEPTHGQCPVFAGLSDVNTLERLGKRSRDPSSFAASALSFTTALSRTGRHSERPKLIRDRDPVVAQCWGNVSDIGPIFNHDMMTFVVRCTHIDLI